MGCVCGETRDPRGPLEPVGASRGRGGSLGSVGPRGVMGSRGPWGSSGSVGGSRGRGGALGARGSPESQGAAGPRVCSPLEDVPQEALVGQRGCGGGPGPGARAVRVCGHGPRRGRAAAPENRRRWAGRLHFRARSVRATSGGRRANARPASFPGNVGSRPPEVWRTDA